ncbi:MAG: hypothetical protein ACI86H_002334, partial [bacterium]
MRTQTSKNPQISYHLEYIRCRKTDCPICSVSSGHGPYWFASMVVQGSILRLYLGKKFREANTQDFLSNKCFWPTEKKKPQTKQSATIKPQFKQSATIKPQFKQSATIKPQFKQSATIKPQFKQSATIKPQFKQSATIKPQFKQSATIKPQFKSSQ